MDVESVAAVSTAPADMSDGKLAKSLQINVGTVKKYRGARVEKPLAGDEVLAARIEEFIREVCCFAFDNAFVIAA